MSAVHEDLRRASGASEQRAVFIDSAAIRAIYVAAYGHADRR